MVYYTINIVIIGDIMKQIVHFISQPSTIYLHAQQYFLFDNNSLTTIATSEWMHRNFSTFASELHNLNVWVIFSIVQLVLISISA